MSELEIKNVSSENIIYCLQYLAAFDSEEIEGDDFEIAVNDDQFATMSIVRTAELGADLITKQAAGIKLLREAVSNFIAVDKEYFEEEKVFQDAIVEMSKALAATNPDKE